MQALAATAPARATGRVPCQRRVAVHAGALPLSTEASSAEAISTALHEASSLNQKAAAEARAFRRELNKSDTYLRRTFNNAESLKKMESDGVGYSLSGLVAQMRESGNTWKQGDLTITLAEAYGFCWGVERAVQMAYEARQAYPDRKLHITNEIIHNPSVNARMHEMDVNFIEIDESGEKDFSDVKAGEVVILPAFGASVQEMRFLHERNVQIVDTTCPWVAKVWNAVDKQAKESHTSVIHGKYSHEETVATASFAGDYLIVKDLDEGQYVVDYILNGGDKAEFLEKFKFATSAGFDPDTMLDRLGVANQTTMLKGDTEAIGKMMEKAMMQKFGPAEIQKHFMVQDTICDATQERQDAMHPLTEGAGKVDLMMVVGGFNSSNTSHLQEIAEHKDIPSFWVSAASNIDVDTNTKNASGKMSSIVGTLKITHKTSWGELVVTKDWLKPGPMTIGITSGASTPDQDVEQVLAQIFKIRDPAFAGIEPKLCAPVVSPTH